VPCKRELIVVGGLYRQARVVRLVREIEPHAYDNDHAVEYVCVLGPGCGGRVVPLRTMARWTEEVLVAPATPDGFRLEYRRPYLLRVYADWLEERGRLEDCERLRRVLADNDIN
jgi:hypothetical protein